MRFHLLLIVFAWLGLAVSATFPDGSDLSTPEKSFALLTETLQGGAAEKLQNVATQTGIESLTELNKHEEYANDGIQQLGRELAASELSWEELTEEIFVLTATHADKTHQLEFTLEEPGWMLYHWQLKRKD